MPCAGCRGPHRPFARSAKRAFHRELSSADGGSQGIGLGLPMAQYWTDRMNGCLSLTSDGCGLGTTAHVAIPMDVPQGGASRLSGLPTAQTFRKVGSCIEAVSEQLQWLGCEEWTGLPPGADAPALLTVQEVGGSRVPQYAASIPTRFVDIVSEPQAGRPDNVESWSYLVKPVDPVSLLALIRQGEASQVNNPLPDIELRVLVVDDSPINRKLMQIHLQGWIIEEAGDGLQGLNMARDAATPYHAILMDINMPVMDGLDATRGVLRVGSTSASWSCPFQECIGRPVILHTPLVPWQCLSQAGGTNHKAYEKKLANTHCVTAAILV